MKHNLYNKSIIDYKKNGWVIVRNFFEKKEIEKIKYQILNKISKTKKNKNFYYEKIGNRRKLRRIESISDFSANSKKIIYSSKILKLIHKIKKKNLIFLKIN